MKIHNFKVHMCASNKRAGAINWVSFTSLGTTTLRDAVATLNRLQKYSTLAYPNNRHYLQIKVHVLSK
jgi:hypothetical protein